MKNQLKKVLAGCLGVACLAFFLALSVTAEQATTTTRMMKVLPDLIVKSVKVTKTGETAGGDHEVLIEVVVMNTVPRSSAGASKLKCEFTEDPTIGFTFLAQAGITSLSYGMHLAKAPSKKVTFTHVVPHGKAYKYRLMADYTDLVKECKEDNNYNSAGYNAI
jgi:hypothetical protein